MKGEKEVTAKRGERSRRWSLLAGALPCTAKSCRNERQGEEGLFWEPASACSLLQDESPTSGTACPSVGLLLHWVSIFAPFRVWFSSACPVLGSLYRIQPLLT